MYLPEELVCMILQNLSDDEDSLFSLCLASKRLHSLASPLLYRKFKKFGLQPKIVYWDHQSFEIRGPTRLECFIRTLIECPDLAAKVKDIEIEGIHNDYDCPGITSSSMNIALTEACGCSSGLEFMDLFQRAAREIPALVLNPQLWHQTWRAELKEGSEDAEIALLLTLVPNLKTLDIFGMNNAADLGYLRRVYEQLLGPNLKTNPPILSCLESLTLRAVFLGYAHRALQINECNALLALPSLRSLCVHEVETRPWDSLDLCHVLHVKLDSCNIDKSLIDSCKELQSLEFTEDCNRHYAHDNHGEIINAISQRSLTLESLILPHYEPDFLTRPLDFTQFTKLKHLEVTYPMFFKVDAELHGDWEGELADEFEIELPNLTQLLPASIEKLILMDFTVAPERDISVQVEGLFISTNDFTNLRDYRIELSDYDEHNLDLENFLLSTKSYYTEMGVSFVFHYSDGDFPPEWCGL